MADERDPKVSQHYRDLGTEEPSRELDQSILAAAHRAADKPHAPLVTPAGRHRWYYAFGAAAILVLAVAVTVHVEREQPDPETMAGPPAAQPAPRVQELPSETFRDAVPAEQKIPGEQPPARMEARRAPAPAAAPSTRADTAAAPQAAPPESPERWLERIVQLRKEGRHEEADRALAEFRRQYPDHKVPDAALK
jgi:hypothetical protein